MKTSKNTTEKNESKTFNFLPEMVLENLNYSKPVEYEIIIYDAKKVKGSKKKFSKAIVFDPLADSFNGLDSEMEPNKKKKKKLKIKK